MKKCFFFLLFIVSITSLFSQNSMPVNYQGVIRDNQGLILVNEDIELRFTIIQGNPNGTAVYIEDHQEKTNQFGLVNIELGTGLVLGGDFYTIDWSSMDYYLKLEFQKKNGNGFADLGTSKLNSVPFANYALNAGNVSYSDTSATNEIQIISLNSNNLSLSKGGGVVDLSPYLDNTDNQTLTRTGNQITISGGNTINLPNDNVFDGDSSHTNELQVISFSNDTLTLSNGGKVYLGAYNNSQAILFNAQLITSLSNKQSSDSLLLFNLIQTNSNNIQGVGNQLFLLNQKVSSDSLLLQSQLNTHISQDNDLDSLNELQILTISNDTIYLSKGGFVVLPTDEVNDADSNPTNELQILSLSNDTLTLSYGGFVVLPDTIRKGSNIGDMLFWNGTIWDTIPAGQPGQFLQVNNNGTPSWTNNKIPISSTDSVKYLGNGLGIFYIRLISDTNTPVFSYGICWGNNANPTLSDNHISFNSTNRSVSDTVHNLSFGSVLFFRSFAINSNGTYYGNQVTLQTPNPNYNVGSIGPSGGHIFYDKGFYSNGWRYLEAAPPIYNTSNVDTIAQWGCNLVAGANNTGIGSGLQNTIEIVNSCGNTSMYAARYCLELNYNGFNDWFLPSPSELLQMKINLHQQGLGSFFNLDYYSSAQASSTTAYYILFGSTNNSFISNFDKTYFRRIRPVRRF